MPDSLVDPGGHRMCRDVGTLASHPGCCSRYTGPRRALMRAFVATEIRRCRGAGFIHRQHLWLRYPWQPLIRAFRRVDLDADRA
jgi:hypothetical protein